MVKHPAANTGDVRDIGLIPEPGGAPREGHENHFSRPVLTMKSIHFPAQKVSTLSFECGQKAHGIGLKPRELK